MIFKNQAEDDFKVESANNPAMDALISRCANIYLGNPEWIDLKDGIRTINFAKTICSETARLAMLATSIKIDGSARATWLQQQIDAVYYKLRQWVEYGCAYGTIFLKPNGKSFDVFTPQDVLLIDYDNTGISGIIFRDSYTAGKKVYTRLEYHRFTTTHTEDGRELQPYIISNKTYVSKSPNSIGDPIPIKETRWADLLEETPPILKANGERLDAPMFGMFRTPQANNIDITTPLGMPIFAEAIEESKDLDIAYSRNAGEIFDSKKLVLIDDRIMAESGTKIGAEKDVKLPEYVKNVFGQDASTFYQEINPTLNTDTRLAGLNAIVSQLGYKCGFSSGYFVFDQKTGMVTATQVEADDRRTIQLIKDVRDNLESCLNDAIYAMSVYADLYGLAPAGAYEVVYDFGDITYNREEDRMRWWQYVNAGKAPAWKYFVKFEGMSEEEARAMVDEAKPKETGLFGEE